MHKKSIYITGASGFLGSHLLAKACRTADTYSVYGLARSNTKSSASDRISSALREANYCDTDLPYEVIEADITQPLCSVNTNSNIITSSLIKDKTFLHVAATLDWQSSRRSHIELTNEVGTQNALALANHLKANIFVYVSTAYTCGKKDGDIKEEMHSGSEGFNNLYENSKLMAERHVAKYCTDKNIPFIIMRPSIILGSSHNYQASGSDTGLYGLIHGIRSISERLKEAQEIVRLQLDADSIPSLIPVNDVVDQIFKNLQNFEKNGGDNIFHITSKLNESSATSGEIMGYILEKIQCRDLFKFIDYDADNKTRLEHFLGRRVRFFSPYFNSTKNFHQEGAKGSSLSFSDVKKYIDNEVDQIVVETPCVENSYNEPHQVERR